MSRHKILEQIRINKPSSFTLGDFNFESMKDADLYNQFCQVSEEVGGCVTTLEKFHFNEMYSQAVSIGSLQHFIHPGNIDLGTASIDCLQNLDVAILKAEWAVAENGAVWLPEKNMGQRIVPFITKHLILSLEKTKIVATMHEAYKRLKVMPSYGVFISGPSKTADIEQTLVIGAQGPLSLRIILV